MSLSLGKRGIFSVAHADDSTPIRITDPSPLQLLTWQQLSSQDFNGDDIERTHEALWNKDGYLAKKGGIPAVSETVDTVIVGGGISGLLAAYYLRAQQPVVLEQANNFGGNSRGEYFPGQGAFSIGAAYITKPDEGSAAEQLLHQLGLAKAARGERSDESRVFYQNQFFVGFWRGATDPQAQEQFQKVYQQLQFILNNQYPDIPWTKESALSQLEFARLDQISLADWLTQTFGSLHPHVLEYLQLYCWSSFGGSIDELSAAQALNFLAAETDEVLAFPGGNAAIAQALCHQIHEAAGPQSLRAGHLVLDIKIEADGVRVCYETPERQLRSLKARHCIVAAPKFVAKRVVSDMSLQQQKACDTIDYRAYVVANLFIDTRRKKLNSEKLSPCFDLYCLEGSVPPTPSSLKPPQQAFTDICFGSWAQQDQADVGVLTIYKPLPFDGARQFLFSPLSHTKYRASITSAVRPLLAKLGVHENEIMGVRLTRWGHSLPLAEKGALTKGYPDLAAAPISQRIFFANQDNWVNPSFEAAVEAAVQVAHQVSARR